MKKENKKKKQKKGSRGKKNSVQELLGIQHFTKYGLMTEHGELVFFQIAPTNISVLSYDNIERKISHLQGLISMHPDLEIVCTDSCECFDGNREYLRRRALEESNLQVRSILEQDREMLSQMQSEMSNARQFYLVMRFRNLKPEMVFTSINEARKRMAEKGFEAHRLTKPELKRFLAIYLEASMDGDKMPDVDGRQYGKGATKNGYCYYNKEQIPVKMDDGSSLTGMVYIMDPRMDFGNPSKNYYDIVRQGYEDCGLDTNVLDHVVNDSMDLAQQRMEGMRFF